MADGTGERTVRASDESVTLVVDWQRLLDAQADVPANPERWSVHDAALAYSVGAVELETIEMLATA